jgi:hypothetical protein
MTEGTMHRRDTNRTYAFGVAFVLGVAAATPGAAAVESAKGIYIPGFRSIFAGVMPGPGGYLQSDTYYYSGKTDGNLDLPIGGAIFADVEAEVVLDVLTGLYVFPGEALGGSFALSATLPIGWQEIKAGAELALPPPAPVIATNVSDSDFQVGDPLIGASLGWHDGNLHYQLAGTLNIPVGSWEQGRLVNMGFNRWAFDATGAVTWLDPAAGYQVSAAAGFTFNGENLDTGYQSGTEFHLDATTSVLFAHGLSLGLAGYLYEQVTGDSGEAARLGPFKGEAVAIGPMATFALPIGGLTMSGNLRWYHEVHVENRLKGDAFYFTATLPLQ